MTNLPLSFSPTVSDLWLHVRFPGEDQGGQPRDDESSDESCGDKNVLESMSGNFQDLEDKESDSENRREIGGRDRKRKRRLNSQGSEASILGGNREGGVSPTFPPPSQRALQLECESLGKNEEEEDDAAIDLTQEDCMGEDKGHLAESPGPRYPSPAAALPSPALKLSSPSLEVPSHSIDSAPPQSPGKQYCS